QNGSSLRFRRINPRLTPPNLRPPPGFGSRYLAKLKSPSPDPPHWVLALDFPLPAGLPYQFLVVCDLATFHAAIATTSGRAVRTGGTRHYSMADGIPRLSD